MKAKKAKKKVAKKTVKKAVKKLVKKIKVAKKAKKTKVAKKPAKDIVQVKHPDGGYIKINRDTDVVMAKKKTKFAGLKIARKKNPDWFK